VPEISIITPSLDSADVIADCLRSVAVQGAGVEHIVVDGQSRDATRDVIAATGLPVRVLEQPPAGIYAAVNGGIEAAGGEIVGILHADDVYAGDDVLPAVRAAFADPAVGVCYGDLCYVDRRDPARIVRYWRAGAYRPERFRQGWMPPHPTFFVRRDFYQRLGSYRTDLGTAADYELMLRFLLKHQVPAAYLPRVLVHMRTGGRSNASLRARLAANRMDRAAWRVNGLRPLPWTLLAKPARKLGQWWQRP